jgi:hypothetical protein
LEPIEEKEEQLDENDENHVNKKDNTSQIIKSVNFITKGTSISASEIVQIDRETIFQEELAKIQNTSLFSGIKLQDKDYFNIDKVQNSELNGLKVEKNPELAKAIEMEHKGYSKLDMTQNELQQERKMFKKEQYSLDFMLDDDDLQDDEEIREII